MTHDEHVALYGEVAEELANMREAGHPLKEQMWAESRAEDYIQRLHEMDMQSRERVFHNAVTPDMLLVCKQFITDPTINVVNLSRTIDALRDAGHTEIFPVLTANHVQRYADFSTAFANAIRDTKTPFLSTAYYFWKPQEELVRQAAVLGTDVAAAYINENIQYVWSLLDHDNITDAAILAVLVDALGSGASLALADGLL